MTPRRSPYEEFHDADISLRDLLAIDRTIVANERTLLSYVRTTLALMAAGGALVHLFEDPRVVISGWVLLALSLPIFGIGFWHYLRRRVALTPLVRAGLPIPPHPDDPERQGEHARSDAKA